MCLTSLPELLRRRSHRAWIAWYPILFLSTSYIGELYKRASPEPTTEAETAAQNREATIHGTRALFYFAIVTLFANFIMPLFVLDSKADNAVNSEGERARVGRPSFMERCRVMHLCELWAFSLLLVAVCMGATL
jgi:solute carrier family 45 protein 1/2/4